MVRAVARALSIFDAFTAERPLLSLQELSDRLGMAKATTFRLVNTLEREGYLVRESDQRYGLSLKFTHLARLVHQGVNVRDVAVPLMREINRDVSETVTLNVRSGMERLVLEVVETPAPLMAIVQRGESVPLLYGATGRILLCHMSAEERRAVYARAPRSFDVASVEAELETFRAQGYAITRNQRVEGVTAIAVPLYEDGVVRHCLAVTGPSVRIDPKERQIVARLLDAGAALSQRLRSNRGSFASSLVPELDE